MKIKCNLFELKAAHISTKKVVPLRMEATQLSYIVLKT
jgi:hypothetical protein